MKYEAILYDMDGTVLDTLDDLTDSVNHALAQFDFPPVSPQRLAGFLGNGAIQLIIRSCPPGTDEETIRKMYDIYTPWYGEHCSVKTAPYEGIIELMQKLRNMGVKQAVISNKPDIAVKPLAERYFPGLLELAVGDSSAVRRKPAPDTVFAAAREMNVPIEKCVYIGDTEVDVETARNAGIDGIAVTWGFRTPEELIAAGATTLVNNTEELFAALTK